MAVNSSSLKSFSLPSLDLLTVGEKEGQFVYATEDEFISVAASSGLQVRISISLFYHLITNIMYLLIAGISSYFY